MLFDENALIELSNSIKEYGVIQPLVVKKIDDYYQIVAGERRWRASKIAGLKKIPVIIKDYDTDRAFEIALVENLQRENLNPMEEAASYKKLSEEFGFTHDKIAERVGKSRSVIANSLRLLNLDERVQNFVKENKLTNGHARALLSVSDNDMQFELAEKIIEEELSVRQIETIVKGLSEKKEKAPKQNKPSSENIYGYIENELSSAFGTKVNINSKKNNKGRIEIEFYSTDDLDRIMSILKSNAKEVN